RITSHAQLSRVASRPGVPPTAWIRSWRGGLCHCRIGSWPYAATRLGIGGCRCVTAEPRVARPSASLSRGRGHYVLDRELDRRSASLSRGRGGWGTSRGCIAGAITGRAGPAGRELPALWKCANPALGRVPWAATSSVPRMPSHVQRPDGHAARVPEAARRLGGVLRVPRRRAERAPDGPVPRDPQGYGVPLEASPPGRAPRRRVRTAGRRRRHRGDVVRALGEGEQATASRAAAPRRARPRVPAAGRGEGLPRGGPQPHGGWGG